MALTKGYPKGKENDSFVMSLFDELEKEKKELANETAMHDREQARALVLQFAMRIFLAADNEDRAASQFLEVTRVFGDVPDEIEDRLKYAKWKAADIVRALNEGRQPQPGPPTSSPPPETTIQSPPIVAAGLNALPSMSGQYPPPSSASAVNSFQPTSPPQLAPIVLPPINNPPVPVAIGSPPAAMNYGSTSPTLDPSTLASAEKLARFAVSALQFEDISTAIQNMEQALLLLRGLQKK